MKISKNHIDKAAQVVKYLEHLSQEFPDRWERVIKESGVGYPFGDLAYGAALVDWEEHGKPSNATFSYEEGNREDPFLIEFRKELSQRFGIQILTIEEGKARSAVAKRVHDWGLN